MSKNSIRTGQKKQQPKRFKKGDLVMAVLRYEKDGFNVVPAVFDLYDPFETGCANVRIDYYDIAGNVITSETREAKAVYDPSDREAFVRDIERRKVDMMSTIHDQAREVIIQWDRIQAALAARKGEAQ